MIVLLVLLWETFSQNLTAFTPINRFVFVVIVIYTKNTAFYEKKKKKNNNKKLHFIKRIIIDCPLTPRHIWHAHLFFLAWTRNKSLMFLWKRTPVKKKTERHCEKWFIFVIFSPSYYFRYILYTIIIDKIRWHAFCYFFFFSIYCRCALMISFVYVCIFCNTSLHCWLAHRCQIIFFFLLLLWQTCVYVLVHTLGKSQQKWVNH